MTPKEQYLSFCRQTEEVPLFLQPWWLDAVTLPDGKQWDVLLACGKHGRPEAALPFLYGNKWGMRYAMTPQLTQYTGVWIKDAEGESLSERLSREKRLQNELLQQLKALRLSFFEVRCSPKYTNWLPFYWAGYSQETHYTYRIEDLSDMQQVFDHFDYAKQKQIHKAQEAGLTVDYSMTADELYDLQCLQLAGRGTKDVLSRALVRSAVGTSRARGQGMIARARDAAGETHAAVFAVWNEQSAWELVSAIHPAHRSSGASTMVVWEAMKRVSRTTRAWDFEGSMIEGVENSFRQYGAAPTPYFQLSRYSKPIALFKTWKR